MDQPWHVLATGLLVYVIYKFAFRFAAWTGKRGPYPPGPPKKWIVGNMFDFPTANSSEIYAAWGKKYNSSILHASALGNHVFVLNDREDAEELFNRRATKYSGRPLLPIADIMGWEKVFALFQDGDYWLRHRIICKKNFGQDAVKNHHPVQRKKVQGLLDGLVSSPENLFSHIQLFSTSMPLMTMYGYDVKSNDDPCVDASNNAIVLGDALLLPGATFINAFPFLRHVPIWFPGASARKLAERARKYSETAERIPMEYVEKCMAEGTAQPSLMSDFLQRKYATGVTEEEERIVKNVAYTIYGGASDTTMASTETFFYLMVTNPGVQMKAQEEIDRVIGSKRLPDFGDRESIPYIEAIYREVMRWHPALPMSGPRRAAEDDWYKGYFIPKGTIILMNLWAMCHNEEIYPEPSAFKPERHLNDDGSISANSDISLVYGLGRRVCPGKYMATSTMWLVFASVLACFNIEKAKDEHGKDIEIDPEYDNKGFTSRKKPFKCTITPRPSMLHLLQR